MVSMGGEDQGTIKLKEPGSRTGSFSIAKEEKMFNCITARETMPDAIPTPDKR